MNPEIAFVDNELIVSTRTMLRRWRFVDGALRAVALVTRDQGRERNWIARSESGTALRRTMLPPDGPLLEPCDVRLTHLNEARLPVHAQGVYAVLSASGPDGRGFRFHINAFRETGAIVCQLQVVGSSLKARAETGVRSIAPPSGVETDDEPREQETARDLLEAFVYSGHHAELTLVELVDQTDIHDSLAFERTYSLGKIETVRGKTCLAVLEDPLTFEGLILIKLAALPNARPIQTEWDVKTQGHRVQLLGHGLEGNGFGCRWAILGYTGGRLGRTRALHGLQRSLRTPQARRDGMLLSNTWGDRNRDSRIDEAFIQREMNAAAHLVIDVCEIDDGWEQGITANSAQANERGGVCEGFYAKDPAYWEPRRAGFPSGLEPLTWTTQKSGVRLGLWFAPDSANDFENWRKDVEVCLGMWRRWGVQFIKLAGIKVRSQRAQENLLCFLDAVIAESSGAIIFDLDITSESRPGYFGAIEAGQLFVENRYTDWAQYYPYRVLRNIWSLAWYVPPQRLRMEFLNPRRNIEKYGSDPLAPSHYPIATLFAIVMVTAPLAFFEVSELDASVVEAFRPLIVVWKQHRAELHGGTILPIGACPSGASFTGFCSESPNVAHLIVFRELTAIEQAELPLPLPPGSEWEVERRLAGKGSLRLQGLVAQVTIENTLSFGWWRLVKRGE